MYSEIIGRDEYINDRNSTPLYVYISLNNTCNANCIFCDVHQNVKKYNSIDVYSLVDELSEMNVKYIHFMGGGEPFTDTKILNYMEYISEKKIKIVCTTNALALDEQKIERLIKCNLSDIFISIDGANSEIHDSLRRVNGIFNHACMVIKYLKKVKPDVNIIVNHVLNERNINFFEDMIRLREAVPFDFLNVILVKDNEALEPTDIQRTNYINNINNYAEQAQKVGLKFFSQNINVFDTRYNFKNHACYFPYMSAYIDCPTGDVYPCDCTIHRSSVFCYGNLIKNSFTEIWNNDELKNLRKKLKNTMMSCKEYCDIANIAANRFVGEKIWKQ